MKGTTLNSIQRGNRILSVKVWGEFSAGIHWLFKASLKLRLRVLFIGKKVDGFRWKKGVKWCKPCCCDFHEI